MKRCVVGMLAVVCGLSAACSKKAEERPQTAPQSSKVESVKDQAIEQIADVKEKAVEQIADVKEKAAEKIEGYKEIVVSATRPIAEVRAESETLSVDQLKATALKYKDSIATKSAEIQSLMKKFNDLPMTQKLGNEAMSIKDKIAEAKQSMDGFKARYDVYVGALKARGVDVSTFLE